MRYVGSHQAVPLTRHSGKFLAGMTEYKKIDNFKSECRSKNSKAVMCGGVIKHHDYYFGEHTDMI